MRLLLAESSLPPNYRDHISVVEFVRKQQLLRQNNVLSAILRRLQPASQQAETSLLDTRIASSPNSELDDDKILRRVFR